MNSMIVENTPKMNESKNEWKNMEQMYMIIWQGNSHFRKSCYPAIVFLIISIIHRDNDRVLQK